MPVHRRPPSSSPRRSQFFLGVGAVVALVGGLLIGAAVLGTGNPQGSTAETAARSAASGPARGGADQAGRAPTADDPVTLAFAGDVHFAGRAKQLLNNPATAFGPIAKTLSAADLAMVNLETAITDGGGTPQPKSFRFRAPATAFAALRAAGIDIASMANNHGVDYGRGGLADTLRAIERTGFPVVGIGADARAAYAPYITEVDGNTIAFLGVSLLLDYTYYNWTATETSGGIASTKNMDALLDSVARARRAAEVVVVYVHWGAAGQECPTQDQQQLARTLADAGVDVIVGTHAHLLQGAGYLGDTYVAYGLGNFLWWRNDAFSDDTGVLTLTLRDQQVVSADFTPALIDGDGRPQPVTGAAAKRKSAVFRELRSCTGLTASPTS